jgi:hypothetical protein
MANNVILSGLTDYIEQRKDELFVKAVAGARTLDFVELFPDVVYKTALNYLDTEVVLADGSTCTWDPAGSDVFSERFLEVVPITIQKEYCAKDFRKKWMNYQLQWEAGRIELPLMDAIANSQVNAIKEAVDELVWQGNSGLSYDGYIALASADTGVAKVEFASGATATAKVDAVVAAVPMAALKKGVNVFLSYSDFRAYIAEQNASCCANRPVIDAAVESIKYLGDSRITLIPVICLEGTGAIVAASKDALAYGTDIVGSEGVYKWLHDEKLDKHYFKVDFTSGVAIKLPNEVVLGI